MANARPHSLYDVGMGVCELLMGSLLFGFASRYITFEIWKSLVGLQTPKQKVGVRAMDGWLWQKMMSWFFETNPSTVESADLPTPATPGHPSPPDKGAVYATSHKSRILRSFLLNFGGCSTWNLPLTDAFPNFEPHQKDLLHERADRSAALPS